jgi:signal transduction histidine kinase
VQRAPPSHVTGAVLLVEDITGRVALERSARQAEKLAALGTLAAGLAHELNNPIGIISSRIEIMLLEAEAHGLPPGVADDLRVLHRHAQRVGKIAQGLLSFSRQSSGQRGVVDLNHLVAETLVLVEKQLARDGIVLKTTLAPWLPAVGRDANALQQVVLNLVTNARGTRWGRQADHHRDQSRAGRLRRRAPDRARHRRHRPGGAAQDL